MELSLLQHAKDNQPVRVQLEEETERMRSGKWPDGYRPLLVIPAVVEGGHQKKHIRWLTGIGVAHFEHLGERMTELRGKAEVDLHTMFCLAGEYADDLWVAYPYELQDSYATNSQMRFYAKAFAWGCDYYSHLLGVPADRTCGALTQTVTLRADSDAYCNLSAMTFTPDEILHRAPNGQKTDKPPARATPKEIEAFLKDRVSLRRNLVTGRVECSPDWQPITNDRLNSLWADMKDEREVGFEDMFRVMRSERFPDFHPFQYYLDHLPPWDGGSHIAAFSTSVIVKGDANEQMLFYQCLRKWLVAMVVGWIDTREVNNSILVLVGRQGIYKTTWFNYLLPPALENYIYTKTNSGRMQKDDLLRLASYGLVCCEELDTMDDSAMNQLKSAMTARTIDERPPFERFSEHRKHVASFCGTGNNKMFINDRSGTRRWLPFEVESIASPRDNPPDYENIYAEAYALYRNGFEYWFSDAEEERLRQHNKPFEIPSAEEELVGFYFRLPEETEHPVFYPTAIVQRAITSPYMNVSTVALGRTLSSMGYRADVIGRHHGYYMERRKDEEVKALPHVLAYRGLHGRTVGADGTDGV